MSAITDYEAPLSAPAASSAEQTVPIVLTTSLSQYAIPSGPYMVPVSWRRTHLSTLVNKLVSSTSNSAGAVPFDFIIDSALLRTTLGDYLEAGGLTSESTLTIEYVRSTLPPTRLAAFEHDDWVASVDCSYTGAGGNIYMTSSYDGSVRLFSPSNPTEAAYTFSTINKATVQGGKNTSLTSAAWTPGSDVVVTGGMDGRVQFWTVSQSEEGAWTSARKWQGEAHNAPISSVDTAQGPAGVSILSGGWDGIVAVWDDLPSSSTTPQSDSESEPESEEESSKKRRKTANGKSTKSAKPSASKAGLLEPTIVLYHAHPVAHAVTGAKNVFTPSSRVSCLLFERSFTSATSKDSNRAWSAGYNGLLKGWDLANGGTVHTSLSLPSSTAETRPILSLAHLAPDTVVAGSMDRAVHIFDTRSSASGAATLGISIASAHRGPVDVLSAHPTDSHLFASGSGLEDVVKVWDTRSSKKALFSLSAHVETGDVEKGVLALDWSKDGQEVVAGGKDKRITVFRGNGIGTSTHV